CIFIVLGHDADVGASPGDNIDGIATKNPLESFALLIDCRNQPFLSGSRQLLVGQLAPIVPFQLLLFIGLVFFDGKVLWWPVQAISQFFTDNVLLCDWVECNFPGNVRWITELKPSAFWIKI